MASISVSFSCAYLRPLVHYTCLRPLVHCRSIYIRRGIYTASCLRQGSADQKTTDMSAERIEVHKEKMSAPYGSWKSPITADIVSGADKRLGGFALDGEGRVIWLEGRPTEAGRSVLVREAADAEGTAEDITPSGFNVRTLVHEYGGGAFTVSGDVVVFSNYKDQRLYKLSIKGDHAPIALTPDYGAPVVRYADGVMDLQLGCYVTVREDHRESDTNPTTTIVSVELNGAGTAEPHVLVSGSDFYAFPRLTPDGGRMAWIEWNHPNMPWDNSELWVGYMSPEGKVEKRICIAGNDPNMIESSTKPKWSSQGYGREYRERLKGAWGIVDVNDCCSCAEFLVTTGRVDGERLCITGGSAGGYTTLAALVFRETFKAGASLCGVADLSLLKADTHKFESYYTDGLVGEDESLLYKRSPINFVDRLSCPMILFHGLEDKVVPPEQARKVYSAMKEKGLPVVLIEYEGEQHGFGKAENIKYTIEQQMVFFARLIGKFKVADDIIPVHIENFD